MFALIQEWMKNLSGYLILAAVLEYLVPQEQYRSYIRFFTGLVLAILLADPLLQILKLKTDFSDLFQEFSKSQEMREIEEAQTLFSEMGETGIWE